MSDLDSLRVSVLETPGQSLGKLEVTMELVALGRFVNDLQLAFFIQLIIIRYNDPGRLVRVVGRLGLAWVQREVVTLNELRSDQPDLQSLQKRNETKIDSHRSPENNGLCRGADRILDLVGPDIFH